MRPPPWFSRSFQSLTVRLRQEWHRPVLPIRLSWRMLGKRDSMAIRRAALRGFLRLDRHLPLQVLALSFSLALWPFKAIGQIRIGLKRFGAETMATSGRSQAAQATDQLRLALSHGIAPLEYYIYSLADSARRRDALNIIYDGEAKYLSRRLNADPTARPLADKHLFARTLQAHSLSCVSSLAWTQARVLRTSQGLLTDLPPCDLFIKPTLGMGGMGTVSLRWLGRDRYAIRTGPGFHLPPELPTQSLDGNTMVQRMHLLPYVQAMARHHPILIQPRLDNHPDIADLSRSALLNVRALTGLMDGRAELVRAVFRLVLGSDIVVQGGIVAPIDEATGILGTAVTIGATCDRFDTHPDTGGIIRHRLLPDWHTAVALAIDAHLAFPGYPFIAWDIALTPQGPVMLEGNVGYGTETLQKPHGQPLMQTRFADICLAAIHTRNRPA